MLLKLKKPKTIIIFENHSITSTEMLMSYSIVLALLKISLYMVSELVTSAIKMIYGLISLAHCLKNRW
jgi:hypothetical protein